MTSSTRGWLPLLALLAVWLGMTAAWVAVAIATGQPSAWMALVVVVDVAALMHMTRARRGPVTAGIAALATALTIASAYWMITATYLGAIFGLTPIESAQRLGPVLAWELTTIRFDDSDPWLLAASVLLAALAAWIASKSAPRDA
jgi:hypothetical protein